MSPSKIVALARLARLHFLIGTGIAYLVGALMARREDGVWNWTAFGLGLLVVWSAQLAAHFFNETYDQPTDRANRHRTPFSGGSGVLIDGRLKPEVALWAGRAMLLLSTALFIGSGTLPSFGVETAIIFGLALIGAAGYSAPPLSLVNRGWGELDTAVIGALLVPSFGYNLQTGRLSLILILTCLPFAALIFANMLNVAFPDHVADRATGKRTLVVMLGPDRAARLYSFLLVAGYVAPWLTLGWGLPLIVLLAESATLPLGLLSLREVRRGGYRMPERFERNTRLGVSAVMAVGVAEVIGFLVAANTAPVSL
jgi:1,4-dihydroxy-2-naphthoate octaprenyltransferase